MEKPKRQAPPKKNITPIEKIYQIRGGDGPELDMKKINRPKMAELNDGFLRLILFMLAGLIVCATVYLLFFNHKSGANTNLKDNNWYAVKLRDNSMIYYGQISDVKANPITIANVYYDYDQNKAVEEKKPFAETGDILLFSLKQATRGGDGSMLLYQCNILLEPLRQDSKVLKAILDDMKKKI